MDEERIRKQPTYIVDIDGTLALRVPGGREWMEWDRVGEDDPNPPVIQTVKFLQVFSTIVCLTGRNEVCRWQTEMWLRLHGINFHELLMRSSDDHRHDWEVKKDIYERDIQPRYPQVIAVLEDRVSVVNMWREIQVPVFQVAEGDF